MKPSSKPGNTIKFGNLIHITHCSFALISAFNISYNFLNHTVNKDMHNLTSKQELNKGYSGSN